MTSRSPLSPEVENFFACCYWMFCWPYLVPAYFYDKIDYSIRQRRAQRCRNQTARPLPRTRPRALTLPLPEKKGLSFVKPKTYSQVQSLFRLPSELRLMIYQGVFGNDTVHMVPMDRRLGSFLCTCPTSSDMLWSSQHACWNRQHTRKDHPTYGMPSLYSDRDTGINVLPLLLTCRTIYSESINFLYSNRTFDFRHLDAVLKFAFSILPQRLSAITSLHLDGVFHDNYGDWNHGLQYVSDYHRKLFSVTDTNRAIGGGVWEATCQVLAGMSGLKRLHLDIASERFYVFLLDEYHGIREERVFGPLREITQCDTFEIEVDWPETEGFKKGYAPFQLTRRPVRLLY